VYKNLWKPGLVVQACNPSTWRWRQEDPNLEVTLGYMVRPCLKKTKKQNKTKAWAAGLAQVIEHLPSKGKALSSNPSTAGKKKKKLVEGDRRG
jgi:hypothetical protein